MLVSVGTVHTLFPNPFFASMGLICIFMHVPLILLLSAIVFNMIQGLIVQALNNRRFDLCNV